MPLTQKEIDELNSLKIDPAKMHHWARIIVYGDFGTGKTTWACKSDRKTLVIDSSQGYVTLRRNLPANVTFMEYRGLSQINAVAEAIEKTVEGFDYNVVVLDEASVMAALDLERLLMIREGKERKGATEGLNALNADRDVVIPEQRDYLASQRRVMFALNALLASPCHVVMLSHQRIVEDKKTGVQTRSINFAPGLASDINRTLHVIGYMTMDNGSQKLQVVPSKGIQAKNRLGLTAFDSPSLESLLSDIETKELTNE